jgi:hypothetical protein
VTTGDDEHDDDLEEREEEEDLGVGEMGLWALSVQEYAYWRFTTPWVVNWRRIDLSGEMPLI